MLAPDRVKLLTLNRDRERSQRYAGVFDGTDVRRERGVGITTRTLLQAAEEGASGPGAHPLLVEIRLVARTAVGIAFLVSAARRRWPPSNTGPEPRR